MDQRSSGWSSFGRYLTDCYEASGVTVNSITSCMDGLIVRAVVAIVPLVLIADVEEQKLIVDDTFRDEGRGGPCVDVNQRSWPHGDFGNAEPHSMLFVVAGGDFR
jgi:hypothetical protein